MRILSILLIFSIVVGVNIFIFYRLYIMIPPILPLKILLFGAAVVVQIPFFTSILLGNSLPSKFVAALYRIGTSWLIIIVFLSITFAAIDICRHTFLPGLNNYISDSWIGFFTMVVIISTILLFGNLMYHKKRRVEIDVFIKKHLDKPLKLLLISDLHLGYGIGNRELKRWVKLINAENADTLLIAGDVVDNHIRPLFEQKMQDTFSKIKTKNGVYLALGNHDYFGEMEKRINFFKEANINVLRDQSVLIEDQYYVIGREDASRKYRKRLESIIDSVDRSKPIIALDHRPTEIDQAAKNGVDLLLCGHTHNGQVFPINLVSRAIFGKSHGWFKQGDTGVYVTSGIGLWGGKFRIGTRSEYVVINLIGSIVEPNNTSA